MSKHYKKLMKKAIEMTGGFVPTTYNPMRPVSDPAGKVIWLGQRVLNPKCTRAMYQQLKKIIPRGSFVVSLL